MIMCSFMKGLVMFAVASALCEVSDVSRSLKKVQFNTTTTPALLDACNVSSLHCFALWLVSKCIEYDATQHPHCRTLVMYQVDLVGH